MIVQQIRRIKRCSKIKDLVVATSVEQSDDLLANMLKDLDVKVYRGPLEDVHQRFVEVLKLYPSDDFVRLTADCPLTDPEVIDLAITSRKNASYDYFSNSIIRSFPHGLDVEAVSTDAFLNTRKLTLSPFEKEHVTPALYLNPELFSVGTLMNSTDLSLHRWTVDYHEDLAFVREIYDHFAGHEFFSTKEILAFVEKADL